MKSIEYESRKANFPEFVSCITFAEESWADPGAEIEDLGYRNGADMKATQKKNTEVELLLCQDCIFWIKLSINRIFLQLREKHIYRGDKLRKLRYTTGLVSISQLIKGVSGKHQGLLHSAWIIHHLYPLLKPVTSPQWFPACNALVSEMRGKLQ